MLPLLRSEIFRLSRRLMPRVLLLVVAVAVVAIYLLLWSIIRTQPEGTDAGDIADLQSDLGLSSVRGLGLGIVQSVGTVMVVILAVSTVSSEYSWGTIRTILPRASGRMPFLAAKLVLLLLFVVAVVVLGFLASVGASALVTALEGLDAEFGENALVESLAAMARTGFVMLPYLALGFLVALWTRSTAAGITVALVVLFLEGLLVSLLGAVGGPLERVPDFLLAENVSAVTAANGADEESAFAAPSDLPGAWQGAGVLAAYTVGFLALAFWRFRTRDITSA